MGIQNPLSFCESEVGNMFFFLLQQNKIPNSPLAALHKGQNGQNMGVFTQNVVTFVLEGVERMDNGFEQLSLRGFRIR